MISKTQTFPTVWVIENVTNKKQAQIHERYEQNLKTGRYERYYVTGPDGKEIKPHDTTAFDVFSEAEAAARKSVK